MSFKNSFHFHNIAQKNTPAAGDSIQNPCIIIQGYMEYVWIVIRNDNVLVFIPCKSILVLHKENPAFFSRGE